MEIIKNGIRLIITIVFISLFLHSCVMDRVYYYNVKNNADYTITVSQLYKMQLQGHEHLYPDTTLPQEAEFYPWNTANTGQYAMVWEQRQKLETIMERECVDTICVFVFKTEQVQHYDWDSIRSNYLILQRYDLSPADVDLLYDKLCFPPSEAMKNIHMWPPYGTYDESGNIIRNKKETSYGSSTGNTLW